MSSVATRMAFGQELIECAKTNKDFVVCNADTKTCGLEKFGQLFPGREFSFGIAEQNLVGAAAGLASCGNKVYLATFAVFASMRACEQLRAAELVDDTMQFSYKVYCQSYSTEISEIKDCYIMGLPMKLQHHYEVMNNDGVVAEESTHFGNYRGKCLDIPVSHVQIIDLFSKKDQKEKIYEFYKKVCLELSEMGY